MKKRFMALLLSLTLVLGLIPVTAMATGSEQTTAEEGDLTEENDTDDTVTVYFSVSEDANYVMPPASGTLMALQELEVPYFDLEQYDLTDYYFISETYSEEEPLANEQAKQEVYEGKVTMLHMLIYATEVCYLGLDPARAGQGYLKSYLTDDGTTLNIGGDPGSLLINNFWDMDMDLRYYLNYEYPYASEGWGATADQILLEDGDVVTLGHFNGGSGYYSDDNCGFHYIKSGDALTSITAAQGDKITLTAYLSGEAQKTCTSQPDLYCLDVSEIGKTGFSAAISTWDKVDTFDANGNYTLDTADMNPGEYILCIPGQNGGYTENVGDYSNEIVSAPGAIHLTLTESEEDQPTEDTENTYDVSFYGHTAQLNSFKLYTFTNNVKGETDLLANVEGVSGSYANYTNLSYTIALPEGDYWLEGYDSMGDCSGGIVITVTEDTTEFIPLRAYQIYASNSGWVLGTDYEVSAEVTNSDKSVNRQAVMGSAYPYSSSTVSYPSCLCLYGDTVKITYTPIGDRAETCMETFKAQTMTANSSSWSQKIPESIVMTYIVPKDSKVSVGKFHTYYIYDFIEEFESGSVGALTPDDSSDDDDSREYHKFKVPKESVNVSAGPYFFYRVQNEAGVTYWDFFAPASIPETTVEITEADLFIGNSEITYNFNKDTIYRFDNNTYDMADIYMNINSQGYLSLEEGDSYELNMFRNWMAIENFYNRKVAIPDMHYEIINVTGDEVITITPDEDNSCVADLKAVGEGTAIVLVTYDAMYSTSAYVSGTANKPNKFSAIWPENTGVFVVTVGAGEASIKTNMYMDRLGSESLIDAEHDPLFYVGDAGAEFSFNPEKECIVTVNRSTVTSSKMSFGTFTDSGVTTAADGTVTVSGLTTGRHIIKIEKGDEVTYQVVTAKQISYELQDTDGNVLTSEDEIKAGDTVVIQFTGLTNPCEKMSGNYNHSAVILYQGEDGTSYQSLPGGNYGVYDFSGNPVRQKIEITIPKYWTGNSYTLNGAIKMNISGSGPGAHRATTYEKGLNANYNATTGIGNVLSQLPDITIGLTETEFLTGTLSFKDTAGNAIDRSNITDIVMADTAGNNIEVEEDGTFACVAEEYSYTIYAKDYLYQTGTVKVSEDGNNVFVITLTASAGAWDGLTETEPSIVDDVYQILNGAELAWFVNTSKTASVSGKLTNDINLGNYPWRYGTGNNGSIAICLDGDGYTIRNFSSGTGLFGMLGNGSQIKNLTMYGEINAASATVGAFAGTASGANTVIENCVNYVTITSSKGTFGGIVGANSSATIQNCVNHGTISPAEGSTAGSYVGGIAGSTYFGTIKNSYNDGQITGAAYVGGITGYDSNGKITLTGCYNSGSIKGTQYVGGIIGSLGGYSFVSTMTGCYNTGTVEATTDAAAGLVAYIYNRASVSDCYNVANVTAPSSASYVGGAVARVYGSYATAARCYYLEGTAASDKAAILVTSDKLKTAELDAELFGGTCTGYPALRWQTDVKFHETSAEGTVTAPTCTEKGYTTYTCSNSNCSESYRDDYTDALGHDWCECSAENAECADCAYTAPTCTETGSIVHTCRREGCEETKTDTIAVLGHDWCECSVENTECTDCAYTAPTCTEIGSIVHTCRRNGCNETSTDVIPANGHTEDTTQTITENLYKDCVCSVCSEPYRVWNDSRLQYMNLADALISDISLTDNGSYPWGYNETKARFESSCNGVNSGKSETVISVTLTDTAVVSFNYGVSSENNFDKLTISAVIDGQSVIIANAISGTNTGAFEQELPAGSYTLTFSYGKDVSGNNGDDCGWFSDLKIAAPDLRPDYVEVSGTGVSELKFSDANNNAWSYNTETGRFESAVSTAEGETSETSLKLTLTSLSKVSFDYGISSSSGTDTLTITAAVGGQTLTIADGLYGTQSGTYTQTLPAGSYTLTFTFTKGVSLMTLADEEDTSESYGYAWLDNLSITTDLPESGYYVVMPEDMTVSAGDSVVIPVAVGSAEKTGFNAVDMSFSYDSDILELTTTELAGYTLTSADGTVRVQGYGDTKAFSSGTAVAFTLSFKPLTTGEAEIALTSAKVDESAHAISADAPEAELVDGDTKVTVGGYTVSLPDDFIGDGIVNDGDDYTFTAKDKNYVYTITATIDGTPVSATDNGDGTFTVENVTGNLVITSEKTGKTVNVTISDTTVIDGASSAQYMVDYDFTLNREEGYTYEVTIQIGGVTYTAYSVYGDVYRIHGEDITGDITITVTKTATEDAEFEVIIDGTGAGVVEGESTVKNGEDYTFTVNGVPGYTYTVTATMDGEPVDVINNGDGTYTIKNVTGKLEITVTRVAESGVKVKEYVELDGSTMFLVLVNGTLETGKVFAYDGEAMFYSESYESYCYLTIIEEDTSFDEVAAAEHLSQIEASAVTIMADNLDVNMTDLADINDAQLVYDMYNGKYADFTTVSMQKFLRADINGSFNLNVEDAAAIVAGI